MRFPVALAAMLLAAPALAHAAPASGEYADALLLAYDPTSHVVTGYFHEARGEGPSFDCTFFLRGTLAGSSAALKTGYPPLGAEDTPIAGQLKVTGAGTLDISLAKEPGGCGMTGVFAGDAPKEQFTFEKAHPWTAIRAIKSAKAYFYDAPTSATHRRAYVVQGDGVGVRAAQAGWLQVDYIHDDKTISGWIKEADVYPAR
jgi:hypothetical protein